MGAITLDRVGKSFGDHEVISDVSLTIPDGAFTIFVGPSGCGKSTLLRLISGLEPVSRGRILLDGSDVTGMPPARRGLAMVFQSYALYPHMTVAENMGFGLRTQGVPKPQRRAAVEQAAAVLKLTDYLDRKP
jgi:multiple sugar transport system ATP-binding protein